MIKFFNFLILIILACSGITVSASESCFPVCLIQDTISAKQILYNGRIWRNFYSYKVKGDQFLFSQKFLPGSVTMNGQTFEGIDLRYDIYNDEVMIITSANNILQLNKEMVDRFSIIFNLTRHNFVNVENDSLASLKGYAEILFDGKTSLYVKHSKEIQRLKEGKILENFIPVQKTFIVKEGRDNYIKKKKDLKKLLIDKKIQVRSYMRSNKIKISKTSPQSIVPVLKFYESLGQ